MTAPVTIELPWPAKELSPNARVHWGAVSSAKRIAKSYAWALAHQAQAANLMHAANLSVAIEFCPPDRRARDLDNMLASLKASLDGVAMACGVDDSRWTITIAKGAPRQLGAVVVTLTPIEHEVAA